jgi:hypothetical protein
MIIAAKTIKPRMHFLLSGRGEIARFWKARIRMTALEFHCAVIARLEVQPGTWRTRVRRARGDIGLAVRECQPRSRADTSSSTLGGGEGMVAAFAAGGSGLRALRRGGASRLSKGLTMADSDKRETGSKGMSQIERDAQALREKTARLRELRLAHEAAKGAAAGGANAPVRTSRPLPKKGKASKPTAKGSLSDWLDGQKEQGRRS